MDILYYWKNVDSDIATGKIGWLVAEGTRLKQHAQTPADNLWIVKTPTGHHGYIELLGRLQLVETPTVVLPRLDKPLAACYDPESPLSIWYTQRDPELNLHEVSRWMKKHFPEAVRANFQGDNGVQPLRGDKLTALKNIASRLEHQPFSVMIEQLAK